MFLTLVLAGCGFPSTAQAPSAQAEQRWCNRTSEPHYAYVVVQHTSGVEMKTCVNFTPSFINGVDALSRSGIEFETQPVGTGTVVCQIDREPANTGDCGAQLRGGWHTYVTSGGSWRQVGTDLTAIRLYDAQAIAWRYVPTGFAPSPPPHL